MAYERDYKKAPADRARERLDAINSPRMMRDPAARLGALTQLTQEEHALQRAFEAGPQKVAAGTRVDHADGSVGFAECDFKLKAINQDAIRALPLETRSLVGSLRLRPENAVGRIKELTNLIKTGHSLGEPHKRELEGRVKLAQSAGLVIAGVAGLEE